MGISQCDIVLPERIGVFMVICGIVWLYQGAVAHHHVVSWHVIPH